MRNCKTGPNSYLCKYENFQPFKNALHFYSHKYTSFTFRRIQQRMSCELLANLASYLLNDPTIFEIVNSLLDIQHIIEKELFHERIEVKNKHICECKLFSCVAW